MKVEGQRVCVCVCVRRGRQGERERKEYPGIVPEHAYED